jgi:hypothetical protein
MGGQDALEIRDEWLSEPPADPVVGRSILGFVDVLAVMVVAVIIAIRHEGHRTTSNAPAVASPATDCRTVLLRPARRGVNRQSRRIPRSSLRGRWSLSEGAAPDRIRQSQRLRPSGFAPTPNRSCGRTGTLAPGPARLRGSFSEVEGTLPRSMHFDRRQLDRDAPGVVAGHWV